MKIIAILGCLASTAQAVLHKSSSVYENIDNCPAGLSGTDCSIEYITCPDNKRRCFNNSNCSELDNPDENGFQYECTCFFAESVSPTAGYECEHSATVTCPGNHFCTNGGTCGQYQIHGHEYKGCNCPKDFTGVHCQYLVEAVEGGIEGETMPQLEDTVVISKAHLNLVYGFTVIFGIGFSVSLVASVWYLIKFHKNRKNPYIVTPISTPSGEAEML